MTANSQWLDLFELEHENFRAALDHLIKVGDADWSLRLGAALFRFWETREYFAEGRDAIDRLLALEKTAPRPKLRARLQFAAAVLAGEQADSIPRDSSSKTASNPAWNSTITAELRSR